MTNEEMFDSAVRSAGDKAGVFEYDGETGYFYLYDTRNEETRKVVDAIPVMNREPDCAETDLAVRWDSAERMVGLFIRGALWAVFDDKTGTKYGGHYHAHSRPEVPDEIIKAFGVEDGERCLED